MANIDLTIKTLDSRNHKFTVSDELTVKELKEHIASEVGISAEIQRLIYCGRVLQDDKKLTEYDLNGKVVHLVQRAPPSVNNQPSGSARTSGSRPTSIHYHLDRGFPSTATHTFGPIPPPAGSSSLLRLNTARHMLEDASQSLGRISNVPTGDTPLFTMDNTIEGPYSSSMPFAQAATAAALAAAFSTVQSLGANNITLVQGPNAGPSVQGSFGFRVQGQQSGNGSPSGGANGGENPSQVESNSAAQPQPQPSGDQQQQRTQQQQSAAQPQQQIRNPRVSVFADVIEDMERIQQDLRPHLTTVRQLLRDDPVLDPSSSEYRQAQHTYNQVSECLHYLAHAFHAMSDLMVDFGAAQPREVRARPYVYQQAVLSSTIPIHASISVETTHARMPQQQQQQNQPQQQSPQTSEASTPPSSTQSTSDSIPMSSTQPSQQLPRLPNMSPVFSRHVIRQPGTPVQPGNGASQPRLVSAGRGSTPNAGRPTLHMLHPVGAHATLGRMPMSQPGWAPVALAGHMPPMVYMEVRSNSQGDDQPGVQTPSNQGEFDDFLPCHSRHLRNSRSSTPRRPTAAATATSHSSSGTSNQASQTHGPQRAPSSAPLPTMMDFMNQLLSQVSASDAETPNEANSNMGSSVFTNAMFSSLLQGVMQEVAGVVSGQQSPNTVAHFLRNIPDFSYTAGESFLFDLFMTMAEHLTFRDLMGLFYGMPEVLNQMRIHLRSFAQQRIIPSGGDFSETSVRQGTMTLVQQALPLLQSAAAEASVRPNVDFVATMGGFLQQRLYDIIRLIGAPGENPNFGQLMIDQIRHALTMATALALACFTDGTTSLERVFLTQLRGVSDGVHPAVQEWTTNSSVERLRTLMASINLDQLAPTIEPLVMNSERGRTWAALFNAELEEMQESSGSVAPMVVEPAAHSEGATITSPPSANSEVESMEIGEAMPNSLLSSELPRISRLERLRQEAAARRNAEPANVPEPNIDVVIGSQSWHSQVPQEWIPVIARDIQIQSRASQTTGSLVQAPLSDAYLAGIPSKRRKLAQGSRPSNNAQGLLQETVERAIRSANVSGATAEVARLVSSSPEVGRALLPELRQLGSARLDRDPDYDAERFPNAEKFFHGHM